MRCERKMTRSPSSGAGKISLSGAARAHTRSTPGRRRVLRRNSMRSSSTSEPSHTPECTAEATAAEEELIAVGAVRFCSTAARGRKGGKRRRGAGKMGERALPLHSSRLLIALKAEKPMGRAWD